MSMGTVRRIYVEIPRATLRLDPVEIFLVDYGPGQGSITVTCYGAAWTAYFGGIGDGSIAEFISGVDSSYLSGALQSEVTKRSKEGYCVRVAQAAIDACVSLVASRSDDEEDDEPNSGGAS